MKLLKQSFLRKFLMALLGFVSVSSTHLRAADHLPACDGLTRSRQVIKLLAAIEDQDLIHSFTSKAVETNGSETTYEVALRREHDRTYYRVKIRKTDCHVIELALFKENESVD